MNNKFKHCLTLIALSFSASAFAQVDPAGSNYWIRPVKAPNDTAKVNEFKMNDTTYYLPVGVYVQVAEKDNGDVILGEERLATDKAPVTVASKKRIISQVEFDKAKALKDHLSVINDSLLAVDLKDMEGEGHINIYVRGQLVSSKPEYGKNDTLDLQTLGIKKARGIIILAQDSMLSTYTKIEELQKVKMDLSTSTKVDELEKIDMDLSASAQMEEDKNHGLPLLSILIISILAIVASLAVFAFIKRDWIKGLIVDTKNENSKEQQYNYDNPSIQGLPHGKIKQENIIEKVARLEKEVKSLNSSLKVEKSAKECTQKDLETVRCKLIELKEKQREIISKEIESVRSECNKKIYDNNVSAQKKIDAANSRAKNAEDKAETIADQLNKKFNEEREKVKIEKKKLNETLDAIRKELNTTIVTLHATEDSLNKANHKVENLTAETESFHKHLSSVPYSKAYCDYIVQLIALTKNIQESAEALLKADIEDKYYIFKAIAIYTGKLNAINLTSLYADVEMISKTGFVIKGTPLATYDPDLPKVELYSLTKNYFFTTYLKAYFDALVVLNESMAGLNYLMSDITTTDLKAFAEYRTQIEAIAQKLGIIILTVKIYDIVGSNTDLLATEVDAGIEKHGAILEIENCKVSLIGGAPDNERINVKIQK